MHACSSGTGKDGQWTRRLRMAFTLSMILIGMGNLQAEPIVPEGIEHPGPVDFQREILPILQKKCLACHNATDAESGLVLESPATILKGGNEGPSAIPGKPDESLVYLLASHQQEPVMPPEANSANAENFTPAELGLFRLWIEQGVKGEVSSASTQIAWQPLPPGVNPILAAALSGDGQYVVAGRANQIWVYDVAMGRDVAQLVDPALADFPATRGAPAAHVDLVQSLAFSPDRQWIASGEYRTVKLWRRASDLLSNWRVEGATPVALVAGADRVWLGRSDGSIRLDEGDGKTVRNLAASSDGQPISALAVSPGGVWLASAASGATIRLDAVSGSKQVSLPAAAIVRSLTWLDDSSLVAGCDDQKIYVWQIDAEGKHSEPRACSGHSQSVTSLASLTGGRWISGSADGTLRIWEAANGTNTATLQQDSPISQLTASPDGKRVVACSPQRKAKLWDLEKAAVVAELNGDGDRMWHRDQRQLEQQVAQRHVDNANADLEEAKKRVGQEEESLKKVTETRDKAKADAEAKAKAATDAIAAAEPAQQLLSQTQQLLEQSKQALAAASDDATRQQAQMALDETQAKLTAAEADAKAKAEAVEKANQEKAAADQALESSGRALETSEKTLADVRSQVEQLQPVLTAMQEQLVKQQALAKEAEDQLQAHQHLSVLSAISPDSSIVVTVDAQGQVLLARAADGQLIRSMASRVSNPVGLSFAGDDALWIVGADGQVNRWRLNAQWLLAQTIGSPNDQSPLADRVTALAFSPDGEQLAIGGGQPSRGGELKIYRTVDGQLVRELTDAHSDSVFGVAFSPDGKLLASCGADRFMKVFEVATGNHVRTFEGHTHHVLGVSWRADGRVLATAGADKVVKLWNFADGAQLRTIQGFGKEVTSLEFAGASDGLFVACGDQSLYRCDMGGDRKAIARGEDFLYVVRTSRLGKSIAFGGHDSIVRLVEEGGKTVAELKPH